MFFFFVSLGCEKKLSKASLALGSRAERARERDRSSRRSSVSGASLRSPCSWPIRRLSLREKAAQEKLSFPENTLPVLVADRTSALSRQKRRRTTNAHPQLLPFAFALAQDTNRRLARRPRQRPGTSSSSPTRATVARYSARAPRDEITSRLCRVGSRRRPVRRRHQA